MDALFVIVVFACCEKEKKGGLIKKIEGDAILNPQPQSPLDFDDD
jgi:hypothetical protein